MKEFEDNLEEFKNPFGQKEPKEIDEDELNLNSLTEELLPKNPDLLPNTLTTKKAKFAYTETKGETAFDNELKLKIKKEEEEKKEKIRKKAEKKSSEKLSKYTDKDYMMFFLLVLSPAFNYNYFYLPYLFIGMLYLFILGDLSRCKMKLKYLCEIFVLNFSCYLLIFKIIAICQITILKTDDNEIDMEENTKLLLIDLGICCLKDLNSNYYFNMTFLSELILIAVSGFGMLISFNYRTLKPSEIIPRRLDENKLRKYMLIIYVFLIGYTVFNLSYFSLFYILSIQFVLLLSCLKLNEKAVKFILKCLIYVFIFMISFQIVLNDLFNIPAFQRIIIKYYEEHQLYATWIQLGVNYEEYTELSDILKKFTGYFFQVCCLVMITNTLSKLNHDLPKDAEQKENNKKKNKISIVINAIIAFLSHRVLNFELTRILSILWTYNYRNYFSLGILIFIFISFFSVHTKRNKCLVIFILVPMVTLMLFCLHLSNIRGVFENMTEDESRKYSRFAIRKFKYVYIEYFTGHIYYILIMFLISSFLSYEKKVKTEDESIIISSNKHEKSNEEEIEMIRVKSEDEKKKDKEKEREDEEEAESIKNSINDHTSSVDSNKSNNTDEKENKKDEDKNDNKNNVNSNIHLEQKNINFLDILIKGFLMHIDKISLVVMYFVSVYTVNLVHMVLVCIFIIQIIAPGKINYCYKINLFIFQSLYLLGFIIDLLKVYYIDTFNKYKAFLQFIIVYNDDVTSNDLEIMIYGLIYCFYFQYRTTHIDTFKQRLENKNISVKSFIEDNLSRFPRIKKILFTIGAIILSIYLWILVSLFLFFLSYFEINLLFGIKLIIFLICCLIFIYTVQSPNETMNLKCARLFNRILLIFCCFNTLTVYLYQFLNKDYLDFKGFIRDSNSFFLKNLPSIGMTIYTEDNLYYNFIPHFMSTFIGVLFSWETERNLIEYKKKRTQRNTTMTLLRKQEKKRKLMEKERMMRIKNEQNEFVQDKMYSEKYNENADSINEKSKQLVKIYIILFLTNCYWVLLFLLMGIIFGRFNLSISIFIYFTVYGFLTLVKFSRITWRLKKYIKNKSYYISKVIRYSLVEKPRHIEFNKYYRTIIFRCLLFLAYLFFLSLYFYGIFDLFQHGCNSELYRGCDNSYQSIIEEDKETDETHGTTEAMIKSIAYLLGIYINMRKETILKIGIYHLIIIYAFTFDLYNQKISNYYYELYEKLQAEVKKLVNENNIYQKYADIADLNILIKIGLTFAGIDFKTNNNNGSNNNISSGRFTLSEQFGGKNVANNNEYNNNINDNKKKDLEVIEEIPDKTQNEKEKDLYSGPENNALLAYELYEDEEPGKEFLKNRIIKKFLDMIRNSNDNQQQLSIGNGKARIIRFLKRIFEETIIVILICVALSKVNIWTFIYLLFSFILIATKKTVWKFFILSCFIYISIITQSVLFILNINSDSVNYISDETIFNIIGIKLGLPWYKDKYDEETGFFFGFGINASQVKLIHQEFMLIIVLQFYLDIFSYSIYESVLNLGESSLSHDKFDFDSLNLHPNSLQRLKNLSEVEFYQIKECLNCFNFKIGNDLNDFLKLLNIKKIKKNNNNHKSGLNLDKIKNPVLKELIENRMFSKEVRNNIENQESRHYTPLPSSIKIFQDILYMYFHCFLLILIIVLSVMVAGLLSAVYFGVAFYYLIQSDYLYLGQEYTYPNTLKNFLRFIILIDITLQGIYQTSFCSNYIIGNNETLDNILQVFGLIKVGSLNDIESISYFQSIEIFGKAFIYFLVSLQIIIYDSKNFKRYYLVYLLETKYDQKKTSLINAFTFNNKRVKHYEHSLSIRQKTDQAMEDLKQIIAELNEKLNALNYDGAPDPEQNKNKNKKKFSKMGSIINKNFLKSKSIQVPSKFKSEIINNNIDEDEGDYLDEEEVKNHLREILTDKFFTKLFMWFHEHSVTYKSIDEDIKTDFDVETIKGQTRIKSNIEDDINRAFAILKLDNITESNMTDIELILLSYFDPKKKEEFEKKKLIEEKAKKHIDKFKKFGNNLLKLVKFKKMLDAKELTNKNNQLNYTNTYILELFKQHNEKQKQEQDEKDRLERKRKEKISQFEDLLETKLFQKYLKTSYQIKHILFYLFVLFINNFTWVCYFLMILDHMVSSSLVTLIYPISIFCYALLEYPRPKKTYWIFILFYTMIIICIKFIIQIKLFSTFVVESRYNELIRNNLYNKRIGFVYYTSTFSYSFLSYIIFDALVVCSILINRNLLISDGLWEYREEEIENIYEASERIAVYKDKICSNKYESYELILKYFYTPKEAAYLKKLWNMPKGSNQIKKFSKKSKEFKKYDEAHKTYLQKLFPTVRNEKPGKEFYSAYTIVMFLICMYILLFYTRMDQDSTNGPVNLDTTQFSGAMVIFLIIHIIIMTYDRIIFISQSRETLNYEYIFYKKSKSSKYQGKLLTSQEESQLKSQICENLDEKFTKIPLKEIEKIKQDHNIIFIQKEKKNSPLINKYILHIFCTILIHIMAFFYFPIKGNNNLINQNYCNSADSTSDSTPENSVVGECNDFKSNYFIIIFYILYLWYLLLSGLQIKFGFYDIRRKSLFKKKDDEMLTSLNSGFQSIPFLIEIKNAIDWTFTSTCFSYIQWNKFEAIYDAIFDTYADKSDWDERPVGERISKKQKLGIGGTLLFVLIFLIIIPLILFSSLNPTNKLNNITAAKLNVDLSFNYENGAIKNYNLFENTRADSISDMFSNDNSTIWEKYKYSESPQTRNFNHDQVQRVIFSETSDRNWDLAGPHINNLIKLLNLIEDNDLYSIEISISYELTRPLPAETQTCSDSFTSTIYKQGDNITDSNGAKNISKLREALKECKDVNIMFDDVYSPALRLTSGSDVGLIEDDTYFTKHSLQIGFEGCNNETGKPNYFNSYYTVKTFEQNNDTIITSPLELHIFNDQISETTQGYSVVTFYVTFILLAGTYIREFLENNPEEIILGEMPHPKKIVDLCEGIKIARYNYDFRNEEYLYTILIELMRSPDYLKLITDSSLDQFKMREKLDAEEK